MDALAALKASRLFGRLDRRALRALAEGSRWRNCRGGEYLYRAGDASDGLYLVATGRIRIIAPNRADDRQILGEVGLGETVGEIAVVSDAPHSVDALAMRDTRALAIPRAGFERTVERHPGAMLAVTRLIVERLRGTQERDPRQEVSGARTFALLPGHTGMDVRGIAQALSAEMARLGAVLRLDQERVDEALGDGVAQSRVAGDDNPRLSAWLLQLEDRYRYLIYQAGAAPGPWTRRCLRQADRILLVVEASREPALGETLRWLQEAQLPAPVELILLHADKAASRATQGWRRLVKADFHHHLPTALPSAELGRAVRLICGQGLCLVLGGGGARGFAHVGLLRALEEHGIAVDAAGGTSMGALIGALIASGMDSETLLAALRDTFVENNNLNDYSFRRTSLIKGRKFLGQLGKLFGERRIEDLIMPFYCVSTNLTQGTAMVHTDGRVVDWVGASMVVPGIAPPMVVHGELLVDGGLMRSIPFDTMHEWGRGRIVVSDVSGGTKLRLPDDAGDEPRTLLEIEDLPSHLNLFQILFHTATLTSERESRDLDRRADLALHMPVSEVGMFDWDQLDAIVYRAYHHAHEKLEAWEARGFTPGSAGAA